ncbi:MAG TPA: hypothetical protein VJI73_02110 [Candidatus Paceibacterota bacterium]
MSTLIRGINFGRVWDASGVRGLSGEGYWFHKLPFGPRFVGQTLVTKTCTVAPRVYPRKVIIKFLGGYALNSVRLANPGVRALFESGKWQELKRPFLISFGQVAPSPIERKRELITFLVFLNKYLPELHAPVGLQINYSCPNLGLSERDLVPEVLRDLDLVERFEIKKLPVVLKFTVLLPIESAKRISEHPRCDGLCISNTLPWGALPDRINWRQLFGTDVSPLAEFGSGGLSGAPLLPLVLEWLQAARKAGIEKHINAGGGILTEHHAQWLFSAGADSVFLGSVAFLRPWRVQKIISNLNTHYLPDWHTFPR